MGIMINRRRVCGGKKGLLYDAEVEYLESNGTQWIDTGILPQRGLVTEIDFEFTSLTNNTSILGTWNMVIYQCTLYNSRWFFGSYSSRESSVLWYNNSVNTDRHIIKLDGNGSLYQDGHLLTTVDVSESVETRNMFIYARNHVSQKNPSKMKCYGVKCSKNDVLVADFIPVRVGTTGYLYDRVSKQLFGNDGTGDFILGPDV